MLRETKAPDATANHVLRVLASYADEAGDCWPALTTLAQQTQLNKATVCRALDRLEAAGQISRFRSKGMKSTRYRLELSSSATDKQSHTATETVAQDNSTVAHRNQTVAHGDTKLPRRTIEVPTTKQPVAPLALPDWLSEEIWSAYLEHRKAKRAKMTPHAFRLALKQLADWHIQGQDVKAIIEQSIRNGWTGLFPLQSNGAPKAGPAAERKCADCGASSAQGVRLYKDLGRLRCYECVHGQAPAVSEQEADIPF